MDGAGGGVFLGSVYATMALKTGGLAGDVAAARGQINGLGDSFNDAENRGSRLSGFLGGALRTGLLAGGAAAVAAGGASIKMAGDFEQSLNVLRYNSGATAEQFAQLSARARELGKDASLPGVSAADAALAMNELAKAGLSVNDVLGASKGVLSLAKAGNIDVGLAATTTARALQAFGLEGTAATQVADMLASAANKSTADVQDLAFSLQMAGSGSRQMGVPLQDTIAALGIFSNAGIAGSDAGTSLKAMFQQLANPTKESATLMQQLGLDFFDAQGRFVGLEATAGQLQAKLSGLSAEQRNAALATIFGADASRVAGILANEGAVGFDRMRDAVQTQGAAANAAKAYNDGFKGSLDAFMSSLQTMATDLGSKVLPPLTAFIRAISTPGQTIGAFVDWFNKAGPAVQGFTVFLGALAAGGIVYGVAMGIATAATAVFGAVMAVVLSPVCLVIAAVAALAAIVFVVYRNWSNITGFFANAWEGIKNAFSSGVAATIGFFERLPYMIGFLLGSAIRFLWEFYTVHVPNFVMGVVSWLAQLPGRAASALVDFIPRIAGVFLGVGSQAIATTASMVEQIVGFFRDLPGRAIGALGNFAGAIKNKLKDVAASAWKGFKDGLGIHSPSYIEKAFMAIEAQGTSTVGQ